MGKIDRPGPVRRYRMLLGPVLGAVWGFWGCRILVLRIPKKRWGGCNVRAPSGIPYLALKTCAAKRKLKHASFPALGAAGPEFLIGLIGKLGRLGHQ